MTDLTRSTWEKLIDAALRIYGPLALMCVFFAWQNNRKDGIIEAQFRTQVEMTRSVTATMGETSDAIEKLTDAIQRR